MSKIDNVETEWLINNYERCKKIYKNLADKVWVLKGGDCEVKCGEKPKPVPNPLMPWMRPSLEDIIKRTYVFDKNPRFYLEKNGLSLTYYGIYVGRKKFSPKYYHDIICHDIITD